MKQYLIILFILFEANSIHTANHPFNMDHELVGIQYQTGNITVGYQQFYNSFFRRSRAVSIKYMFNDIGIHLFYTTGYDFKFGLYPVYQFGFKNIFFELGYSPNFHNDKIEHVLLLTKKVKF